MTLLCRVLLVWMPALRLFAQKGTHEWTWTGSRNTKGVKDTPWIWIQEWKVEQCSTFNVNKVHSLMQLGEQETRCFLTLNPLSCTLRWTYFYFVFRLTDVDCVILICIGSPWALRLPTTVTINLADESPNNQYECHDWWQPLHLQYNNHVRGSIIHRGVWRWLSSEILQQLSLAYG